MQKRSGFTLIELLVVMAVVSVILSLVGPLTMQSLTRAEAKAELLNIENFIRNERIRASLQGTLRTIHLDGKKMEIVSAGQATKVKNLEHTFFTQQVVTINHFGFVTPQSVRLTSLGRQVDLQLGDQLDEE